VRSPLTLREMLPSQMLKERASGMYRLSAFYFARTASDLPMDCTIPTVFIIIIYFMSGLKCAGSATCLSSVGNLLEEHHAAADFAAGRNADGRCCLRWRVARQSHVFSCLGVHRCLSQLFGGVTTNWVATPTCCSMLSSAARRYLA